MSSEQGISDAIDESALSALARRIAAVRSRPSLDAVPVLTPPLYDARDHIEGPASASASLVVFGSYGTPASPRLGTLLQQLHAAHPASLRVAWRHLPDAHPGAVAFALAAEVAATEGRFWSLHRELLATRHNDLEDLHAAARRAGLDFYRLLDRMRAGVGAERIVSDLESALASAVVSAPTLFVNGEHFDGELDPATVWAAASRHDSQLRAS
jgi:protein-disulfide isomerase